MPKFVIEMGKMYYWRRRKAPTRSTPTVFQVYDADEAKQFTNKDKADAMARWLRGWGYQQVTVVPVES